MIIFQKFYKIIKIKCFVWKVGPHSSLSLHLNQIKKKDRTKNGNKSMLFLKNVNFDEKNNELRVNLCVCERYET